MKGELCSYGKPFVFALLSTNLFLRTQWTLIWQDIRALFPSDYNPFYAGFGNRDTDELSYRKIGIPKGKIFIINPKVFFHLLHHADEHWKFSFVLNYTSKLAGRGGYQSLHWCEVIHLLAQTCEWYVPTHFIGWAGEFCYWIPKFIIFTGTLNSLFILRNYFPCAMNCWGTSSRN